MKIATYSADSRGHANHGWLNAYHTFSFANYFDPERIHFGSLRVLNDDCIEGGKGFGSHPHDNMEIITIPLSGSIAHQDNMGHTEMIKYGEVQVMSAGTGIIHSEYNAEKSNELNLFQIWIFPSRKNVIPRYDQKSFDFSKKNTLIPIVYPESEKENNLWIHQDAWLNIGYFDKGSTVEYNIKKEGNGLFIMVIEGSFSINEQQLNKRDGMGIWETENLSILPTVDNSKLLLLDIPMNIN